MRVRIEKAFVVLGKKIFFIRSHDFIGHQSRQSDDDERKPNFEIVAFPKKKKIDLLYQKYNEKKSF